MKQIDTDKSHQVQVAHDGLMRACGLPTYEQLLAALQSIADGRVMTGVYSHADTVLKYQEIARKAAAKAQNCTESGRKGNQS